MADISDVYEGYLQFIGGGYLQYLSLVAPAHSASLSCCNILELKAKFLPKENIYSLSRFRGFQRLRAKFCEKKIYISSAHFRLEGRGDSPQEMKLKLIIMAEEI